METAGSGTDRELWDKGKIVGQTLSQHVLTEGVDESEEVEGGSIFAREAALARATASVASSKVMPGLQGDCPGTHQRGRGWHRWRVAGRRQQMVPSNSCDAMAIIGLVQESRHIRLAGNAKLRIERDLAEAPARAQQVRDVLRALGSPKARASP